VIEIAKLEKMVQAEVSASSWWNSLSDREKKTYTKAHPNSRFASDYAPAFHKSMADRHGSRADHHYGKMQIFGKKYDAAKKAKSPKAAKFRKLMKLHLRASKAHNIAAIAHYSAAKNVDHAQFAMRKTGQARTVAAKLKNIAGTAVPAAA